MKRWVNLICSVVPSRKLRQQIRNKYKAAQRRKQLVAMGCTIENDCVTTPGNIKFDISDAAKVCAHIEEIIVNKTYSLFGREEAVVIDIGMNRGVASLYFAAQKNIRRVYAFEPFMPTLELAKKNLSLNPELSKKIQTFACGLGKAGTTLVIPYSVNASDSMSTTHAVSVKKNVRQETVSVKDAAEVLAPLFHEHRHCRIWLKCDCEGAEFDILRRLDEKKLTDKIDAVLMEYHFQSPDDLVSILTENGFAVHIRQGSNDPIVGYLYAVKMHPQKQA